jgi:Fe-Mn family superoxide dismutase
MFELSPLPFAKDAFEPHISARTFEFHHGKHHAGYVAKVNALTEGTPQADWSLEQIITDPHTNTGLFNNAAQAWNHEFFWNCLSPKKMSPVGDLADMIAQQWGDFESFCEEFIKAGAGQFGSGWGWLVHNGDEIEIRTTTNAETPLTDGAKPLLVCDVWEHAYYLDYQNRRPDFLKVFIEELANWEWANQQLS